VAKINDGSEYYLKDYSGTRDVGWDRIRINPGQQYEYASCYKGDPGCSITYLRVLQHCKRWTPATSPKMGGWSNETPTSYLHTLSCTSDIRLSDEQAAIREQYRESLLRTYKPLMQQATASASTSDAGAYICAANLYPKVVQALRATYLIHTNKARLPDGKCWSAGFE